MEDAAKETCSMAVLWKHKGFEVRLVVGDASPAELWSSSEDAENRRVYGRKSVGRSVLGKKMVCVVFLEMREEDMKVGRRYEYGLFWGTVAYTKKDPHFFRFNFSLYGMWVESERNIMSGWECVLT